MFNKIVMCGLIMSWVGVIGAQNQLRTDPSDVLNERFDVRNTMPRDTTGPKVYRDSGKEELDTTLFIIEDIDQAQEACKPSADECKQTPQ